MIYRQVAPGLTTLYLNAMGAMSEKLVGASSTTWRDYIMADGHMVAQRDKVVSSGTVTWSYFVADHLGSIAVITDASGAVTERLSYDAWGKRRNANGTDANCGTISSSATRGFTGHEMLAGLCLVNMNARIYDPDLGRFMTPDTFVSDATNLQDWNAYTYVNNNPLSFTDPTGHFKLKDVLGAAVAIAVIVFAPEFLAPILGNFGAYVAAGAIAGGLSAAITGGNVGLGIVLGGIQAGLTFGVGGPLGNALGKVLGSATIGRVIAQGFVGGIMSAVQGSNFGAGFLAAGVGSLGGSLGLGGVEGFIVSTTLGGLASVLGGGKFANGAITAAFAYVASGRTRGFGAPLTLNDYYKLLAQEGIDGHNIAVSAEAKAFMDQVLGTDEFKGVAKPILDESIATKTETGGIDVYADSNGKPIIVPFKAIPMTCPNGYTGCMGAPLPNASYGKIMFEWHPHPVVGYKNWTPSILDLERSILLNHLPGAIWANQRGNYRESVYQGNCIVGATSCH